jgi:hypothetical protein
VKAGFTIAVASLLLHAVQQLPAAPLKGEISDLVYAFGDFVPDTNTYNRWLQELRSKPGIIDDLWSHLWSVYKGEEEGEVTTICFALAQRDDLSPERYKGLMDLLDLLTREVLPEYMTREFSMVQGLMHLLEKGEDTRAESLAIRMLKSEDPDAVFLLNSALRTIRGWRIAIVGGYRCACRKTLWRKA